MNCRHCRHELKLTFADLGAAPPSNAYLTKEALLSEERYYPLQVAVCEHCWLVQTLDFVSSTQLFSRDYAYFSSYATSWLQHAEQYVLGAVKRFSLNEKSLVVELAANDGYLLQYVKAHSIPCYGVEPTASTAAAARDKGIEIVEQFFGVALAKELSASNKKADLIIANNVLAHVPDINDFVSGIYLLLKSTGVVSFEFPHLLQLVNLCQFDTIYHEHYSYLSLSAVEKIFRENGLAIFDVEELATHGGSLRVYAQRMDTGVFEPKLAVQSILHTERDAGVRSSEYYKKFQLSINRMKDELLLFLIDAKKKSHTVVGYGAAAKGNTLLNYAGVKPDLLPFVIDKNISKQGKFLPGSRIPILAEEHLRAACPAFVLILPWNIKEEIMHQLNYIREWGGKFIVASPRLEILS